MKKLFFAVAPLTVGIAFPIACYAGPFGLDAGMSRVDVIQKIGKNFIVSESKDNIVFDSAPLKSIYFDEYTCFFDPNGKLWAVDASSKPLTTSSAGEDLRSSFDTLKAGLQEKYGNMLYETGSRNSNIRWDQLANQSVFTGAYWNGDGEYARSTQIHTISLELVHFDETHGFIDLNYEFTTLVEDPL